MKESALVLSGGTPSAEDLNIRKVLDFFGVPCRNLPVTRFIRDDEPKHGDAYRLLCSADLFEAAIEAMDGRLNVHSVFVYAGNNVNALQKVLRRVTGDSHASIARTGPKGWKIGDKLPEFCGAMGGLTVDQSTIENAFIFDETAAQSISIVSTGDRSTFVKAEYRTVPVFISAAGIVDLDTVLTEGNFDIRDYFFEAFPIVAYSRWAFPMSCWRAPQTPACVVIDDPLLRPQYGCLNFQDLLSKMTVHNFSTSIAFIPWNWTRNASETTRLFTNNPDRYSLSIHGCDHTGAEFGIQDCDRLEWKSKQALERMGLLESRSGIKYDAVMVFPQGVFSPAAMNVLKRTNYTAAVNTEVISSNRSGRQIRISDLWDVAVMNYSDFPIFTRRYPHQGIENFAFDVLLGKPCLIVIHHENCREQLKHLTEFIDRVNRLHRPLSWCSLGDVVRRSYRQRELSSDVVEVEMYGMELDLKNTFQDRKQFRIRKRENDPAAVQHVYIDSRDALWNVADGHIKFQVELAAGQTVRIAIILPDSPQTLPVAEPRTYRIKTMVRRYLSEFRDKYASGTS